MKKKVLSWLVTCAMLFGMFPATAMAASATVYNAEDLRSAIASAEDGHIITFGSDITVEGEWACCEVPEGVIIRGGGHTFKIGDVGHYDSNAAFYGSGFKVQHLTIERTGTDENGDNALQMNGGEANGVKVKGNFGSGIVASGGVVVNECEFGEGLTWGVNTDGAENGVSSITKTKFYSLRAVALYDTETFTDNEVYGDKGLSVATSGATITGNTFSGERALSISADDVELSDNTIEGAIEIDDGYSADLSGNYWGDSGVPADLPDGVTVTTYYTDADMTNSVELPSGSGAEDDPVLIVDAEDLKWFRDQVNGGNTFKGKYIQLAGDIDLENEDWTPIGNADHQFQGSFDGNNKTIKNLTINDERNYYDGGESYVGLFGYVKAGGYIKDLTIENVQITGCLYVGGVVGRMYTSGAIENCHLTGDIDIEGYWYVGGIAGRYEYGVGISDCSVKGTKEHFATIEADVDAETNKDADGSYVGAIVGFTTEPKPYVTIGDNTVEYVNITGMTRVGGIAGIAHQGNTFDGNAVNEVNIYAVQPEGYNGDDADTIGQIAGACQGTASNPVTFEQCIATVTTVFLNGEVYTEASEYGGSITETTPVTNYVARIGTGNYFTSLDEALSAARDGQTIELISGDKPISAAGSVVGNKTVTITGEAVFDWSKGWLFVGRGGEGDGKLIFKDATITSTEESLMNGSYGIHVSMAEYGESSKNNGEVVFENSTVDLSYLMGKNNVTVDGGELTIWYGYAVGARPASETNGVQNTATMTVKNGAVVEVKNHNGMGVGYESKGVLTVESGATFKYTGTSLTVTANGTVNVNGGTFIATEVARASGGIVSISGESTVQIDKYDGAAARIEDGAVLTNSWIKSTNNGTTRIYGDVTFKGGFETAYLTTADADQLGRGGTITIEDGTTVKATYGVDLRNNYTIDGGTIELSGGNANGEIWGFVFQSGDTFTVNSDIKVEGLTGATAPIHVTGVTVNLNGNMSQSTSGGEPIYIKNGTLSVSKDGSITTDCGVYVNDYGTLKSAGDISGTIVKNKETAEIEISAGTYTMDVTDWCVEGYESVQVDDNTYKVQHKNVSLVTFDDAAVLDQEDEARFTMELDGGEATVASMFVNLYDTEGNLLTTVTPAEGSGVISNGKFSEATTVGIMIFGDSGSWDQTPWTPVSTQLPDYVELYIDDILIATRDVVGAAVGGVGHSLTQEEWDALLAKWYPVAKIGETGYATLADALKALTDGATLTLCADVTVSEDWDCRSNGAKITASNVTIDGDGHNLILTGKVDDKNWNTVFRIEGDNATVKNLTIDASAASGIQRGVSSKLSITVDNCTLIGNGTTAKRAVIFGEGAGESLSNVTATIKDSTFKNWSYGVSDNQSGKDAKSVSITGSTFENSSVLVSAAEAAFFTGNTMENGWVNISSYSVPNVLSVTATGNTLEANTEEEDNSIKAATITAQEEFLTPVAEMGGVYYTSLEKAISKAEAGDTIKLLTDIAVDADLTIPASLEQNGKTITLAAGVKLTVANAGLTVSTVSGCEVKTSGTEGAYTYTSTVKTEEETGSGTEGTGGSSGSGGGSTSYTIAVEDAVNGDITVSHTRASKGTTVTITVDPDNGYELDELTVLDKNGKEVELTKKSDTKYTFKMPSGKVTIEGTFAEIEEFENPFVDVAEGKYYYDAVLWAAENGITGGTTATTFEPATTCTRAQTVTFLWRAAGSPEPESTVMPFTDVVEGSYYYDAVLWAVENGITTGTSATTFEPYATVTRAQNVTFLWRWAESPAAEQANPFTDVAEGKYYHDAVIWAAEQGITSGTTATTFSPNDPCLRSQIVTFLYRYLAD